MDRVTRAGVSKQSRSLRHFSECRLFIALNAKFKSSYMCISFVRIAPFSEKKICFTIFF